MADHVVVCRSATGSGPRCPVELQGAACRLVLRSHFFEAGEEGGGAEAHLTEAAADPVPIAPELAACRVDVEVETVAVVVVAPPFD